MDLKNIKIDLENKKIVVNNGDLKKIFANLHALLGDDVIDDFEITVGNVSEEDKVENGLKESKEIIELGGELEESDIDTMDDLYFSVETYLNSDLIENKLYDIIAEGDFDKVEASVAFLNRSRITGYPVFKIENKTKDFILIEALKIGYLSDPTTGQKLGDFNSDTCELIPNHLEVLKDESESCFTMKNDSKALYECHLSLLKPLISKYVYININGLAIMAEFLEKDGKYFISVDKEFQTVLSSNMPLGMYGSYNDSLTFSNPIANFHSIPLLYYAVQEKSIKKEGQEVTLIQGDKIVSVTSNDILKDVYVQIGNENYERPSQFYNGPKRIEVSLIMLFNNLPNNEFENSVKSMLSMNTNQFMAKPIDLNLDMYDKEGLKVKGFNFNRGFIKNTLIRDNDPTYGHLLEVEVQIGFDYYTEIVN
jgi:hypothetical protein